MVITLTLNFSFDKHLIVGLKVLLVAKEEGQIAGYVLMATSDEQNTQWILSLAVDATHRGKGVARLLVDKVLSKVETGSVVKLTVDPDNIPAFRLYSSLGFVCGRGRG